MHWIIIFNSVLLSSVTANVNYRLVKYYAIQTERLGSQVYSEYSHKLYNVTSHDAIFRCFYSAFVLTEISWHWRTCLAVYEYSRCVWTLEFGVSTFRDRFDTIVSDFLHRFRRIGTSIRGCRIFYYFAGHAYLSTVVSSQHILLGSDIYIYIYVCVCVCVWAG